MIDWQSDKLHMVKSRYATFLAIYFDCHLFHAIRNIWILSSMAFDRQNLNVHKRKLKVDIELQSVILPSSSILIVDLVTSRELRDN